MKTSLLGLSTVIFLSSCALVTKHSEQAESQEPTPVETPKENPQPTPGPMKALKKTITDQDFKKSLENKELKKRVVVLPLIDKKGIRSAEMLQKSQDAFIDALNETGELIALDPATLKIDLNKYLQNGMYDLKGIAQASGKAGISSVLEARVIDMRFKNEDPEKVDNASSLKTRAVAFEVVVQVRMMHLRSSQEIVNSVKTVSIDDPNSAIAENITSDTFFARNNELNRLLIRDALVDFVPKIVGALKLISWEGRIAAMQGDRIYLNVGKISGVQIGDILKVVEDSNEIYDPELGYHVGKVQGKVKGTLEIVGFFGQDGAVSVIHSGAGFKENDRIEVYQ